MNDRPLSPPALPRLCILLGVRNGGAYLEAQLDSIAGQTGVDWHLFASDDGSTDGSSSVLKAFAAARGTGRVTLLRGPGRGLVANYRYLLTQAPKGLALAYADQDDIWLPDKLARAMAALADQRGPALYGSRVVVTDRHGRPGGLSALPRRPLSFRNALVQNVFHGNTLVVNAPAAALLQDADESLLAAGQSQVLHDWWAYLLIAGAGGALIFDDHAGVLYRQHDGNAIGENTGLRASLRRLTAVARGRNADWLSTHLDALDCLDDLLTDDARSVAALVRAARTRALAARVAGFGKAGLYMQRRRAQAGLWLAIALGRM